MQDDLNILENGRRPQSLENGRLPQYSGKWKTSPIWKMTSFIWKMEDNLNYLENEKRPQSLVNDFAIGREPQYLFKWKTT